MSSITQYLTLISLLDLGMGAVIQASMYKPLLEDDIPTLSAIYYKSQQFFNRIGFSLLIYIAGLCILLPLTLSGNFTSSQIIELILILSLSHLLQFFIGITSQIILGSDQKAYIKEILQGLANIANLLLSVLLVNSGHTIYLVKFASALVFIIPPVFISYYVHQHYHISKKYRDTKLKLQQQWYGIGQHIAYTIQESTDIVILSFFSSLSTVSVYAVYNTVFQGIKTFLNAATSGVRPYFGRALHMKDKTILIEQFQKIEWILHTVSTILLSTTFQLITPFVILYTKQVTDANYNQPVFGFVMTFAVFLYALRLPYRTLVFSAGAFKETQLGTYLEAVLNLSFSILLVLKFDLTGVAIGTCISLLFSLFYYIWYCYIHILDCKIKHIIRQLIIDCVIFLTSCIFITPFSNKISNISSWGLLGFYSIITISCVSFVINLMFLEQNFQIFLKRKN
ncbi:TPA: lipopolysaccharide biosynthesis protein [Streptococcus suis]